jgi:hypothetical protein
MRTHGQNNYFLKEFFRLSDIQTSAFVTSNGVNRYAAYRIDMQAFYIGSVFAALALFTDYPETPGQLAVKAIGFQMAVEVARHFNTAIRWTFKIELDLVSVQRLLKYAELQPEIGGHMTQSLKGNIEF